MEVWRFESVESLVHSLKPTKPVFCIRPNVIAETARKFASLFPGTVLYAVKCNPHPSVLSALHAGGIRHFDVASLPEIVQVCEMFTDAHAYFMHPIKDREAIRQAYRKYGIRHFVVDHRDELEKLLQETDGSDVIVFVRVKTPEVSEVLYHLAAKFGAEVDEATDLVAEVVRLGCETGLTFHVGSQCLETRAFQTALGILGEVIERSGVQPRVIDVGGGFPEPYPGLEVQPIERYVAAIQEGLEELSLSSDVEILCEPGRALVASGCSVLMQVNLRKGEQLYVNDGVFGSFSELIDSEQNLLARLLPANGRCAEELLDFSIYGPTCDSMDVFASKLRLPANVSEGDWIEVDQMGAYSNALSTHFNGFSLETFVEVYDDPLARTVHGEL